MSAYGARIDAADGQLAAVDFVRWLLKSNTKGSGVVRAQPQVSMERSSENSDAADESTTTMPTVTEAAAAADSEKPIKQISCVQCQARKIKCDKVKPSCAHCIKSKIGPCEYRPPAPPRRGKRKPTEADLLSRLRRCEELLRDSGVQVDGNGNIAEPEPSAKGNENTEPPSKKRQILPERINGSNSSWSSMPESQNDNQNLDSGNIIVEEGGSRYVESDLWRGIGAETNQADPRKLNLMETLAEDNVVDTTELNDGDFLFEYRGSRISLASFHPSSTDAAILWNTFISNVEPLLKMLHIPTLENEIYEASRNVNVNSIPSGMEALMFAIYNLAVGSMPATECEKSFGIAKSILLARFESAVKKAFVKAGILVSTDFKLLQAMVIWLHSIRDTYHPNALWILSGVALRMAQRAGIHREKALASFSAFDAEMRRRTWWALMAIDSRAAELSGSGISVFQNAYDTEIPRNLNDSDLSPEMTELPPSRTGATEMIFVSLRHEVGKFFKDNLPRGKNDNGVPTYANLTNAKIDAFEQLLEHKFLRFCDALYPLHYLTSIVGRACVGTMRLIMNHPCQYPDGAQEMTDEQLESVWQQSMKLMRYQHLIHSTPALASRFLWHCEAYFPWHAFIYVITTICKAGKKDRAMESWELVQKTFEIYPKMINDTRRPLHVALGNLIIKAWDATGHWFPSGRPGRSSEMSSPSSTNQYQPSGILPDFIVKLRAQRAPRSMPNYPHQHIGVAPPTPSTSTRLSQPTTPGILAQNSINYNGLGNGAATSQQYPGTLLVDDPLYDVVDLSPEAWAEWDKLLATSQTLDFTSEFQNAGSWPMYDGIDRAYQQT